MGNTKGRKIYLFRAGDQRNPKSICRLGKRFCYFPLQRLGPGNCFKGTEITRNLRIKIQKAERAERSGSGKPGTQKTKLFPVPWDSVSFVQQDRIISPEDTFRSDLFRQIQKRTNSLFQGRKPRLHVLSIRIQSKLKIEGIFPAFAQMFHHGCRIFGPEDNSVHNIRMQRNSADLMGGKWISDQHIAFFQPLKKPFRIKSRQVCPAAGAYDHKFSFQTRSNAGNDSGCMVK